MSAQAPFRESIWTRPFILLCATVVLGYTQMALLTPTIPLYVTEGLGGSNTMAGLILLSFSLPSFSLRPLIGYWADAWSAAGVCAAGALLLGIGSAIYLVPVFALLIVGSVIRGLGWAGLNTGGYTVLAFAAPPAQRGEASGWYTSVTGSASIVFPALALWILDRSDNEYRFVFMAAAGAAFAGALVGSTMPRPEAQKRVQAQAASASGPKGVASFIDKGALLATGVQLCSTLAMPAITSFLPRYAGSIGIAHIGSFYIVAGLTSLLVRPVIGRKSDSIGRGVSLLFGFGFQIAGFVSIILAPNLAIILLGGFLNSIGSAVNNATATALAIDLSDPARRGRSMATFSMAFQMGNGFGSVLAGGVADLAGFRAMYVVSAGIVSLGFVLSRLFWGTLSRAGKTELTATGGGVGVGAAPRGG